MVLTPVGIAHPGISGESPLPVRLPVGRVIRRQGTGAGLRAGCGRLATVDMVELRRRVAAARLELTVEANIRRLAELYEAVAR